MHLYVYIRKWIRTAAISAMAGLYINPCASQVIVVGSSFSVFRL